MPGASDVIAEGQARDVQLLPGWAMYQESLVTGADRPYKSSVIHVVLDDGELGTSLRQV